MSQYTRLPASSVGVTLPASGIPGDPTPAQALQVAGTDGLDLIVLSTDANGVLNVAAASLPLPTGAATAANQATMISSLSSIDTKLTAPLSVTGPLTDAQLRATAVPVSAASLPLPAGAATSANQSTMISSLSSIDTKLTAPLSVTGPLTDAELRATAVPVSGPLTDAQLRATAVPVSGPLTDTELRASAVPVSAASLPLPSGAATESTLSTLNGKVPANLTVTSTRLLVDGSGVTQPVSGTVSITPPVASSSSVTSVSASASSVSLLSSNSSRKMATFYNDSTATLYLKLGTTASTTSYTVQLVAGAYYELPGNQVYTGAVDGIWASATGAVRITELS